MSLYRMAYVACDDCGNPAPLADDAKEARANARREGWDVHPGPTADLCPRCLGVQ